MRSRQRSSGGGIEIVIHGPGYPAVGVGRGVLHQRYESRVHAIMFQYPQRLFTLAYIADNLRLEFGEDEL